MTSPYETEKVGLTKGEIQIIEGLDTVTAQEAHVRNVWLFSFYLAGMQVGDVINVRWSDIYDGRLHYRMNKGPEMVHYWERFRSLGKVVA